MDQSSRSQKENVAKLAGATSSKDFLVSSVLGGRRPSMVEPLNPV